MSDPTQQTVCHAETNRRPRAEEVPLGSASPVARSEAPLCVKGLLDAAECAPVLGAVIQTSASTCLDRVQICDVFAMTLAVGARLIYDGAMPGLCKGNEWEGSWRSSIWVQRMACPR